IRRRSSHHLRALERPADQPHNHPNNQDGQQDGPECLGNELAKNLGHQIGQSLPATPAAHRTTSAPRILRASLYRQMSASTVSAAQQVHSGKTSSCAARKNTAPLVV